jgi:threonine aldolase
MGMRVHLDGARIANATAALGADAAALRSFTVDAGVDVVSFGATKAGIMGGEAVVYIDRTLAERAKYVRKQVNQLPSKMRFVSAQLAALLEGGRWIELAANANAMAQRLYESTRSIPGVQFDAAPVVNSVFPCLPADVIEPLREWCFFWDWDVHRHQVRWMTAWDTTSDDVDRFAAGVRHLLEGRSPA